MQKIMKTTVVDVFAHTPTYLFTYLGTLGTRKKRFLQRIYDSV